MTPDPIDWNAPTLIGTRYDWQVANEDRLQKLRAKKKPKNARAKKARRRNRK